MTFGRSTWRGTRRTYRLVRGRAPSGTVARALTPRNLVVVVLDSLRYDSWIAAEPEVLGQLGPVERRWSYATWTAPSHYNLLMGLLPHTSPPEVYASEYYKHDFLRYRERLGVDDVEFGKLLPAIFIPTYFRLSGPGALRRGALTADPGRTA